MKKITLSLITTTVISLLVSTTFAASMEGTDYTARIGAPDSAQMYDNGQKDSALPGISFLRPVLSGVLYRSGIHNSHKGLTLDQLEDLCEAGFVNAVIVDFKDGSSKRGTHSCSNGKTIEYTRVTSRKHASDAMEMIYETIVNNNGPVLAHCRNGVHASNTIAAKALVRFCGWSIADAKEYWERTRNKAPCSGGCKKWINSKFSGFVEGEANMPLSDEQKNAICP